MVVLRDGAARQEARPPLVARSPGSDLWRTLLLIRHGMLRSFAVAVAEARIV